ncbi:50S ribosomal protein L2 [candidate division WOR-1 bacterium RIFOXYA12_FULL_52_29]|uniref:Large ribosomal subunit protein uL2 n=1 Tax=candidate division WOR-1 bacterium RIFOXYC12_FULL_54_18 TaxID=1802584 RepID=A0A1F4T5J2_UNCSA|nr:MAG: 50S ribosomal protein L2 [candidate division WOR-1 bacterium RIFOXYA2_FULL_51_19]OGC17587.1 MAG: 50S ribosomal protein L2 [candidate division WOR-1 bacterium RIFOXYA12_FULL_52_29]OGC26444.1 MAG: 50S ribosomal protein L2 [candidate division WOR-1 bacterium RIFOXYB2_FULL_45_9]OGC28004.1 MAG: 50S ribosomal protein L2 [candidate division WOR-1 bacterium RIFOXYC12_FULL_54_18]OGC29710.1 MAG: 50S ribosomal protein L2 [candidate division WOR-1 bacterium RIFOXYB12_FULL_52_16]
MALKRRNPTSPGTRFQIVDDYSDVTKNYPEKSLLASKKQKSGRDWRGFVSMRHRGGGNKKHYRIVDFVRDKDNVAAKVVAIEYDPNRNCRIALIEYSDKVKSYILAPLGVGVGDDIMSGTEADIKPGNALPLSSIPVGTTVHNVEIDPGRGGKLARSAGAGLLLLAKDGNYAIVKMPSGEQRMIHISCRATVGQVGNLDAKNVVLGKAGKKRHLGRRPEVRGVVMNPCDHPHGGGEGKSGIGREHPVTPWGKPTLGKKTRKARLRSSRFILSRRKK